MSKETTGFADAFDELRSAQKGHARGAPAYSVYVNRRLGRVFAAFAHTRGWTPNQVTAISALNTFGGIALIIFLPQTWWSGLLVAALLVCGYAWDSADGQVARLSGGGSAAGEWLDHFVDAAKLSSLHLAVLVGLWVHTDLRDTGWLIVPLVFSAVSTTTFVGMLLNDLLKAARGGASTHQRGGGTAARSLLLLPTDFGLVCVVFVLWGWTDAFLLCYCLLAAAATGFLMLAAVRWFREMKTV